LYDRLPESLVNITIISPISICVKEEKGERVLKVKKKKKDDAFGGMKERDERILV